MKSLAKGFDFKTSLEISAKELKFDKEGIEMERKLSISLLLSDPDEYEGGELEFRYYDKNYAFVKPDAGTGVIFPSWLPHRVHPVKSGIRRSLVAWMDGPLFK